MVQPKDRRRIAGRIWRDDGWPLCTRSEGARLDVVDDGEEEGEGVGGGGEGESVGGCVRGKGAEVIQSRTTVDNTRCCGR